MTKNKCDDLLFFQTSEGRAVPCSALDVTLGLLGGYKLEKKIVDEVTTRTVAYLQDQYCVSLFEYTLTLQHFLDQLGYKSAMSLRQELLN